MNITLAAPPNVVQNVRMWAEDQGTSLNAYIRDLLIQKDKEIREERRAFADKFLDFAKNNTVHAPEGWKFSREESANRDMKCLHEIH